MLPFAEIYVHEDDGTNQIDGFIGLNENYIEGLFVKVATQSKGVGRQLLGHVKTTIRSCEESPFYTKPECLPEKWESN